ncbi:MAG: hypothetical protein AABY28_06350, partial [Candidatus Omnitrophota bacterium]
MGKNKVFFGVSFLLAGLVIGIPSARTEGDGLASDKPERHGLPSDRQSHSQSHKPEGDGLASD